MKSSIKCALAATLLGTAVGCLAAAAEPVGLVRAAGIATFGQLDELRSQNAMLGEAVKAAELRSKLGVGGGAPRPASAPAAMTAPAPDAPRETGVRPAPTVSASAAAAGAQVTMVAGVGGAVVAHITLQNGGRVAARVGSAIPGLGVVRSISIHEVLVANKKQVVSVPFAVEASAAASPANTPGFPAFPMQAGMPMPPLPTGMPGRGVR